MKWNARKGSGSEEKAFKSWWVATTTWSKSNQEKPSSTRVNIHWGSEKKGTYVAKLSDLIDQCHSREAFNMEKKDLYRLSNNILDIRPLERRRETE